MNISSNPEERWASVRKGSNFIFIAFYLGVAVLYFMMAAAIVLKKEDDGNDMAFLVEKFGIASWIFAVTADVAAGVMVLGWMMFLITHVCFIISDRVFLALLPSSVSFYKIAYPVMFTFVLLMLLMLIYLVLKCCCKSD
ncbi:hypothetical protein IWQ56_000161 [Coemansia nantahalensis]|nr:hypothetical protein IWQ56_000161 [Coemansia nantahalensis]